MTLRPPTTSSRREQAEINAAAAAAVALMPVGAAQAKLEALTRQVASGSGAAGAAPAATPAAAPGHAAVPAVSSASQPLLSELATYTRFLNGLLKGGCGVRRAPRDAVRANPCRARRCALREAAAAAVRAGCGPGAPARWCVAHARHRRAIRHPHIRTRRLGAVGGAERLLPRHGGRACAQFRCASSDGPGRLTRCRTLHMPGADLSAAELADNMTLFLTSCRSVGVRVSDRCVHSCAHGPH
jgi:hypothetical protein